MNKFELFSQTDNDTSIRNFIYKPYVSCETISKNSIILLSKFNLTQIDSMKKVLEIWGGVDSIRKASKIWGENCKESEIFNRFNILISLLNNEKCDSAINNYFVEYYYTFLNYNLNFKYKHFYETFIADTISYKLANYLSLKKHLNENERTFCLLISKKFREFEYERYSSEFKENPIYKMLNERDYENWNSGFKFEIGGGIFTPIGELSKYCKNSFIFNFAMEGSLEEVRLIIYLQLAFINSMESINLNYDNKIQNTKIERIGSVGVRFPYGIKLSKYTSIDLLGGVGIADLSTVLEKNNKDKDENSSSSTVSVNTINLNLGLKLTTRLQKNNNISLHINYNFEPYFLEDMLKTKIGYNYLTTSLILSF